MMIEKLEIRRLLAAGDLDPTFAAGGISTNLRPDRVYLTDSVVLDNDKVLFSGNEIHLLLADEDRAVLARFNADGTPDSTFGDDGYVFHDLSAGSSDDSHPGHIVVQDDGKIVALGRIGFKDVILRFNADGSLDTTFGGGDGMIDNTSHGETFDVLSNGKIIVGAAQGYVTRYLANGIDRIAGGRGNDTPERNAQRDFIDGGDGDDLIVGNGGHDQIRGENGNDHLEGAFDHDILAGGAGNDSATVGDDGDDQLIDIETT